MYPGEIVKLILSIFLMLPLNAFAEDPVFCNGQRIERGGDNYYPNGKRINVSNDFYFPNGQRTKVLSDSYYPNGKRIQVLSAEYFMSGQRVLVSGDLFYPNGRRIQILDECFYSTGVRMDSCPDIIPYVESEGAFRVRGTIDRTAGKVMDLRYEYRDKPVTTYFDVNSNGRITNMEAICEEGPSPR